MMMNPSQWIPPLRPFLGLMASIASRRPAAAAAAGPARTRHQEAEAVRRMAVDLIERDPRFADELFAAASRHEGRQDD